MTAETIAAVATPPGKGAISIVRVSGSMAPQLAQRLFHAKQALQPRLAAYGTIVDECGHPIDRGLALLASAPHSYTGEDTLEFHVHGSPAVVREVMRALIAAGARQAQPGEFTRRAFFNGKLDLHEAGAIADLIDAETRSAARAALANLGGGLANTVRELRAMLQRALEQLAASIDFPEEVPDSDRRELTREIEQISANLQRLLREGEAARIVREGVSVAIVGPPNAGKSSLLNALLGEERAIVSEIAGTTRDTIEESIALDGLQFRLIDTAGIRSHADRLEAAGIERSARALDGSRIALVVIDGSEPLGPEARAVLQRTEGRDRVVFCNKADLGTIAAEHLPKSQTVVGSVRDKASIRALGDALARTALGADAPDVERPHLAAAGEFDAVAEALRSLGRARETLESGLPADLAAPDLQRAHAALGRLTGDEASEELLTGVFSRFCIGK